MNESKPITRIYCDHGLGADQDITLAPAPAHKLRAVLRAVPGDHILLFNGRDGEWRATLSHVKKQAVTAVCSAQTRQQASEPGPWLVFAPLKKERMDHVVEKAVELGVERLIPVITKRTENRRLKMERLCQQIIDAAEQCERLTLPVLDEPILLETLPSRWPDGRALLVCAERQDAPSIGEAISSISSPVGLLIGPEGGFEAQELDAVLALPLSKALSLGPRILRAETAAVAALAVIQAQCGDWRTTQTL